MGSPPSVVPNTRVVRKLSTNNYLAFGVRKPECLGYDAAWFAL